MSQWQDIYSSIQSKLRQVMNNPKKKSTRDQTNTASPVDLVILIDTSPSMKDEAQALSNASASAISAAQSSCPSDLRVIWLGIEGLWEGTHFNQTLRNYLTQNCNVAENKLRSRKLGELKDAGAQEDAARSLEDISNYFNWREGAARAIFYLGDEALDGGGGKTTKKDIEAANSAIASAQSAKVTVHTYFGTSKSKYRQTIVSEYARVAAETGGQAFLNQDAISGFSRVLEKVICGSRTPKTPKLKPGVVYIQDSVANELSKLYTLDLVTGKATLIGEIITEVYDIAFVGSQLYGVEQENNTSRVVKIDLNTGDATVIGPVGYFTAGLAYNVQRQTLYATEAKQLIAIDLETGKGSPVATIADQNYNCSEIAFDANGTAYITLIGYDRKKILASYNFDTGVVTKIGDTGFPNIASLDFVGDVLYGVTGDFYDLGQNGQLIRIDTTTGKGTLIATTDPVGRWAGISLYQPVTEVKEDKSEVSLTTPTLQNGTTIQEAAMQVLTIDTKNNCYVIDAGGMNHLQTNVASSITLEKGTYNIQITEGRYSYAKTASEGEPFVLLWIYGNDGSTFINQNTGLEVGATWTTLNGYNDKLQLEVKNQIVVCALFFDLNNTDNSGSVNVSITSNQGLSTPQTLTVDSKRNCYVLDENYLTSLKQYGSNFIELEPGNYRIKIREGNATYWSNESKFKLEPWALVWLKGGKFVSKLTGIEVKESWCSLNGLKDELIVEVKERVTLSGFFFDTYKEDNQGQIILEIASISGDEITKLYKQQPVKQQVTTTTGRTTVERTSIGTTSRETQERVSVGATGSGVSMSSGGSFSFKFDEAQMEQMWQQMAAKIETSVTVTDEQDERQEAYYWDNLEKWILKGYQTQAKELGMQVARVEFMMKALTQQIESSYNQSFQSWSSYFNQRLEELINTRLVSVVEEQVNQKLNQQIQGVKKIVVEQIQADIDKRVESAVNLKITNQAQNIRHQVIEQVQSEIDKRVESIVTQRITSQSKEIQSSVSKQILGEMDKRINTVVNLKIEDKSQNLKNLVIEQMQVDVDRRIESVVNLKIDAQTQNIKNLVIEQMQADFDRRIESVVNLKIEDQSQNVKNLVIEQIQADIDHRIGSIVEQSSGKNVEVVVNNVINDVDNRIDAKFENRILNFTEDVTAIIRNEFDQNFSESIKTTVFSDLKNQQFYLDMQLVKAEVDKFYARLGQFETQLNLRIKQGDTQLYNWTLEQLVQLQGCMTDRQALAELFESFSARLKNTLDNAPCVSPSRFTAWVTNEEPQQIGANQPAQLPAAE